MCPGYLLGISWNLSRLDLYRHPVYTTVYMLLDTRGLYSSLSAIQLFRADFRASPLNYRPSLTFLSNIPLFLQRSSLFVWCLASIGVFLHEIDRQSIRPMSHVRFYRTNSRGNFCATFPAFATLLRELSAVMIVTWQRKCAENYNK